MHSVQDENRFRFHANRPDIDADAYCHSRRQQLGVELSKLKRVYLDTKHWLHMRDVSMGRSRNECDPLIYERLIQLKHERKLVCPISCTVFWEVMRQSDNRTRLATADVIDSLSDGICTQPPDELVKRELSHLLTRLTLPHKKLVPVSHTVWTKVAFLLGDLMVSPKGLPPQLTSTIQRAFDDELWQQTFRGLIERISGTAADRDWNASQELADELTQGKFVHATECKGFEELLITEYAGAIDGHHEQIADVAIHLSRAHGFLQAPTPNELGHAVEMYAHLLKTAIRHKRISTELPSIFIPSALHAAIRHDHQRKFKANDMDDFRHSHSALPYFDLFVTEKSLKHLLCSKPLKLDQKYECCVLSDGVEILEFLRLM